MTHERGRIFPGNVRRAGVGPEKTFQAFYPAPAFTGNHKQKTLMIFTMKDIKRMKNTYRKIILHALDGLGGLTKNTIGISGHCAQTPDKRGEVPNERI